MFWLSKTPFLTCISLPLWKSYTMKYFIKSESTAVDDSSLLFSPPLQKWLPISLHRMCRKGSLFGNNACCYTAIRLGSITNNIVISVVFSTIFQTAINRVMGSLLHVDSRTSHLERSRNVTPQNRQKIATIHQYMRPDKPLSTKRQKSIEGGHFCILNTCLR